MYSRSGFDQIQKDMTTGRFTFPVVVLLCLGLWSISAQSWTEIFSLGLCALTSFFMIETNTAFTLIRTRADFHISLYWLLASICVFLHPYQAAYWTVVAFMLSLYKLFESYEQHNCADYIFQSFFFLSLGSFAFPPFIWFALPYFIGMMLFRSFTVKTFLAALVGMATPYWISFGVSFFVDQTGWLIETGREMYRMSPFHFQQLAMKEMITVGVILLLSLVSSIHYLFVAYKDKTKTRMLLFFFIQLEVWILLGGMLFPNGLHSLIQLQLILCAFLTGHLFTLTQNRLTNIFFMITLAVLVLLMFYNVWM